MKHNTGDSGSGGAGGAVADDDDDEKLWLSSDTEHENEEFVDPRNYIFDKILAHNGWGSHIRYLAQYKGRYVKGDVKRVWLRTREVPDSVKLHNYRRKKREEGNLRRLAKLGWKIRTSTEPRQNRPPAELKDSSTQVNFNTLEQGSSSSTSTTGPKIKLVFNRSTQTDLTYFIWDTAK